MRALLASLLLVAIAGCEAPETAACDRNCRIEAATAIISALESINPEARITQNGVEVGAAETLLSGATQIDIHGQFADANGQNAIIFGTALDADQKPSVFGLRAAFSGEKVTGLELLFVRNGEVSLFPPAVPLTRQTTFGEIVPEAQRTAPEAMIAAAESYLDGIEASDGAAVSVTPDCQRVENGVQTTNSARYGALGCNSLSAFVYIPEVRERRYPVVDVERGVVVAAIAFYIPGGDYVRVINGEETTRHYDPRSLFLFETFKVVDGKIAFIEATMRNMPLGATMGW